MRILILTYLFPPYGGMVPRRLAYYAKHLVENRNAVDVLTAEPLKNYLMFDENLNRLIPPDVNVVRSYPGFLATLRDRLSKNKSKWMGKDHSVVKLLFDILPLTNLSWLPWGYFKAARLCRKNKYDAIYTFGDPFVVHLMGYLLKKSFRMCWVAEFGDPWTLKPAFQKKPRWRRKIDHFIEEKSFRLPDKIIQRTDEAVSAYLSQYSFLSADKFEVIVGGVDEKKYVEVAAEGSDKFRLVFTGAIYDHANYAPLLNALAALKGYDIELIVAGLVSDNFHDMVAMLNLEDVVQSIGYQPYERIIGLQKGADLLVIFGWAGGYQVSCKLFEYLITGKPIMLLRHDSHDIAEKYIIRFRRGAVIQNSPEEISTQIRKRYVLWKEHESSEFFNPDDVREFTWDSLGAKLEKIISQCISSSLLRGR